MKERILVTGSKGFTGKYVCAELQRRGYEVYGLTSDFTVEGKSVDLRDRRALSEIVSTLQPNGVVHLAAVASVDHGCDSDFLDVNVNGTRNLLDSLSNVACLKSIVVASSANIYGNALVGKPISEDVVPDPQNLYAESKLKMEEMIRGDYACLPITIVRPFNYTGLGQSNNYIIAKIVDAFRRNEDVLDLGNLNVFRDFSDVRFVSWAYAELISSCSKGDVLNFCSGVAYSIGDIVEICSKLTKHRLKVNSKINLRRSNEVLYLKGDPTHMIQVLGRGSTLSMEDTLQWMIFSRKLL